MVNHGEICMRARSTIVPSAALTALLLYAGCSKDSSETTDNRTEAAARIEILNVSYDPTRELFREYNELFARHWKEQSGQEVTIQQSHGGSGSQARAVIDGLQADVVTLALAYDIDAIAANTALLPANWQGKLPLNSAPYYSTVGFLVRKGNPKNIQSWKDLARPDVQVITANPKTSGVARWNFLAMWGFALREELGPGFAAMLEDPQHKQAVAAAEQRAKDFVTAVYQNVPVLDRAARGSTNTFVQRRIGDVLINWENEILLGSKEFDEAGLEMVIPPISIKAETVVAVVEANADRKGTGKVAQAYLEHLYSEAGQDILGRFYYRPAASEAAQAKYRKQFAEVEMFSIDEVFGGWHAAHARHFAEGGTFDQIYRPR
jgi:sulfate/thiosulfate transport system substrate-binding protein